MVDFLLQWVSYYDVLDESVIFCIYGGIYLFVDDIFGCIIGVQVGNDVIDCLCEFFGVDVCIVMVMVYCLNNGCFCVEVSFIDFSGNLGSGQMVVGVIDDLGFYWFFELMNWEMMVKVFDGCVVNDCVWVFGVVMIDVVYEISVIDMMIGEVKIYMNELGEVLLVIMDMDVFLVCLC